MATATIILVDEPDGGVNVMVHFSNPGLDEKHPSHAAAVELTHKALQMQAKVEEGLRNGN